MRKKILKRALGLMCSFAVLCSSLISTFSVFAEASNPMPLQNFFYRINNPIANDPVQVGYLGGSVTQGSGSSNASTKSWAALVGNQLAAYATEHGVTLNNINAGIGATGSFFGSYRAQKYLKMLGENANPVDLLFVEFAINDAYDHRTKAEVQMDMESIVLQTRQANPYADIVFLFTTDFQKKDTDFDALTWQKEVAEHYGIPYVYLGKPLWQMVVAENGGIAPTSANDPAWRKYITDDCHPNDSGYQFYADILMAYIDEQLTELGEPSTELVAFQNPATTITDTAQLKLNGQYAGFWDNGFRNQNLDDWHYIPNSVYITCDSVGASFDFAFTGTAVGFWCLGYNNGGEADFTITSKTNPEFKREGSFSMYSYTQLTTPVELATDLPLDTYIVKVTSKAGPHGTGARLCSVLINGEASSIVPYTEVSGDTVKAALEDCIIKKGNAVTRADMLATVQAFDSDATIDEYFIRHAVDGVYDEDPVEEHRLSIPGHDGYVAVTATVGVVTTSVVVTLSHTEELYTFETKDVWSADNTNFTMDASGNITSYTGTAQKVVIPSTFTKTITKLKATNSPNTFDNTTEVIIYNGTNVTLPSAAFRSWRTDGQGDFVANYTQKAGYTKLKAIMISNSVKKIPSGSFAFNLTLKYLKLPASLDITAATGDRINNGLWGCENLQNVNLPVGATLGYRGLLHTSVADAYVPASGSIPTSNDSQAWSASWIMNVGEPVYLTYTQQQAATLSRAATLAQAAADNYSFKETDTAETVKTAITASYSAKNANITADWNSSFSVTDSTPYGILTITEGSNSYDIKYGEKAVPTNFEADNAKNIVKAAFKEAVLELGNNITEATLLERINAKIATYTVTASDYFVYHAVDGVYDEDDNPDTKLEIKGHDGYASAVLHIKDNGIEIGSLGIVATIPHTEENLGVLTKDVWSADNANFTMSGGNIVAYTGNAQKIVIPETFSGTITKLKGLRSGTAPNQTFEFDNTTEVIIYKGTNPSLPANAFRSWVKDANAAPANFIASAGYTKLKALVISDSVKEIPAGALAFTLPLKYLKLPSNMQNNNNYKNNDNYTIGTYGIIRENALWGCTNLQNVNYPNAVYIDYHAFRQTPVQDIYESQYTNKHINAFIDYIGVGERTSLTYAAQQTATLARAAVLAQKAADTITVEINASNKATVLSTITSAYNTKIANVVAEWNEDYTKLYLTSGNSKYEIACNSSPLTLTMANSASIRTGEYPGLRFTANVSGLNKVASAKFGMLIAPKDYLIGTEFTAKALDEAGKIYLDIEQAVWENANTSYTAVLSNIKQGNYYRYFAARAYADVVYNDNSTERIYSDISEARVYDTAKETNTETATYVTGANTDKPAVHTSAGEWVGAMSGDSDEATEELRNNIIGSANADMSAYTGTTHYISTVQDFNNAHINNGDKVLFQRGKIFRFPQGISAVSGVFYGAYGNGEKPYIYGSQANFAKSSWQNQGNNVWLITITEYKHFQNEDSVGVIAFNNGEEVGTLKREQSELAKNGDFYYNPSNNKVYLYSDENPATKYTSIEIGSNSRMFDIDGKSNVTIDNLAIKYCSGYGVVMGDNPSNITVSNCEFGFIGGAYQNSANNIRHGNAIEVWRGCNGVTVSNNWIYQIYDAGFTNQGSISNGEVFTAKDITVNGNLIEYCGLASIEYWASGGAQNINGTNHYNTLDHVTYSNNIMRFAGYGFGAQRTSIIGYHIYTSPDAVNANRNGFNITGNIFDTAKTGSVNIYANNAGVNNPTLSGNTYMDKPGKILGMYGKGSKNYVFYPCKTPSNLINNNLTDATSRVVIY